MRGGKRKGAGRPKGRAPRGPSLHIRVTKEELERWSVAMEESPQPSLSAWVRAVLNREAEIEPGQFIVDVSCPCCGAQLEIEHGDELGQLAVVGTPSNREVG